MMSDKIYPAAFRRIAGSIAAAALVVATGAVAAQAPGAQSQVSAPEGYSLHQAFDFGGRVSNVYGSGAMYDTLVNQQSGPRVTGETFELRKLDEKKKGGLVDELTAFTTGIGGDPNNIARLNFTKGKLYDFSGLFRRDRQYFDYDLLGNPNIPYGQTLAIGPAAAPTGAFAWPQLRQSPFMFNTVRRMLDTNLTILPLSKVTFRAGYSQNIFQGPSLTPGGYFGVLSNDILTEEFQRLSTDKWTGAIDWKPIQGTKLSFEEQIDHFKNDSYFTLAPQYYNVQEADGTPVALLASYDTLTPYAASSCNAGYASILSAPQTPGGKPVVDPACSVIVNYTRFQPTRAIFPTEQFFLQSTSIKNVTMNGNVRYTNAKTNMPSYVETFNGLNKAVRQSIYSGYASAKREVIAVDYGIAWQLAKDFSLAEQISYSNVQQPGSANLTAETTYSVPTGTPATINYTGTLTKASATAAPEGMPGVGNAFSGFFGQKMTRNNLTATWDVAPNAILSLTWRYGSRTAHYQGAKYANDDDYEEDPVEVTIHENGGILNAAFRPVANWTINGSLELIYNDNVITPVAPRQTQHYNIRTGFKPKPWASFSAAYNDQERRNNTYNTQNDAGVVTYGPLGHEDHSRVFSLGADLNPNEHYGIEFNYAYTSVYTATNVCYNGLATALTNGAVAPGAAIQSGAYCAAVYGAHGSYIDYGPVKDFQDVPTQFGHVALALNPTDKLHAHLGYTVSSANGTRFFTDARDVNGSTVSTYQTPFADVSYALHKNLIWSGQYNYYGYGEGGQSGAQYCTTTSVIPNPAPAGWQPSAPVACSSLPNTAMNPSTPAYGFTAPRNFHANNVSLGLHYEF